MPTWRTREGGLLATRAGQVGGRSATSALALGAVAQAASLDTALVVLAAGLAVGGAATLRLALPRPGEIDVTPAEAMPTPSAPEGTLGPVLVIATYDVAAGSEPVFLAHADRLRHFRQRTGGIEWRLFVDEAVPGRFVETFLVGSWEERERQHARATGHDAALLEELDTLLVPGTHRVAHHYVAAATRRAN
jgi:hypothetical protein